MRRIRIFGSIVSGLMVLLAAQALPVQADEETGWRVRVDFAIVDPSTDPGRIEVGTGVVQSEFDTGAGVGVRAEYQLSPRWGIDFGFLSAASVDVSTRTGTGGTVASVEVSSFSPFLVGADFHLTPGKRVDLYVGPQVAWVSYGDIDVRSAPGGSITALTVDDDLGLGAIVGLDVPVGGERRWAFQTNLRYLATSMENTGAAGSIDVDFDPMIFSVGFGYRW